MPTEEDRINGGPSVHQLREYSFGTRPQWTLTDLSAFAVDGDQCVSAVASSDLKIAGHQLRRFGDARPGVVEEQEHGVFDPAPRRAAVGHLEQRLHLGLAEPAISCGVAFFKAIARILALHSRWAGSRLATKRAKARIAVSR